jgi:hypothetical protein
MIARLPKQGTGRDNMKSIAHFAIAGNYGCVLAAAIDDNHSEQTDRIAISISDITRAPALLCRGIAVASTAAASQEIACRQFRDEGLGEG